MLISSTIELPSLSKNMPPRSYPQLIKYMGSKAKLVDFIAESIQAVHSGGVICDLFSGSCSLSGALGAHYPIHSNDIQSYSALIASVYLRNIKEVDSESLIKDAAINFRKAKASLPHGLEYPESPTLDGFNHVEELNRSLIGHNFRNRYHLFLKNYSGTWWSAEQCLWIDGIKQAIDKRLKNGSWGTSEYSFAMTILLHAMAYSSQGTGHYAQYRDAKTKSSMSDINTYRQKDLREIFVRKFNQMREWSLENVVDLGHKISTLDYIDCLKSIQKGTIYADPPYAFVHYSRFYHAMETLSLYDYPTIQTKGDVLVKGRYREQRHQSPFCIRTQVQEAFSKLFSGVNFSKSNLVLSYSNTGMIDVETLLELSKKNLSSKYEIWMEDQEHHHMTMGRLDDRHREVKEVVLLARRSNA